MTDEPFWRAKTLAQMNRSEWESLCDGCGRCCLIKLRDEDTNETYFTDVACHLLDLHSCRCGNYKKRTQFVPDCVTLTPDNIAGLDFMPSTCAYRLLANGQDLPDWHPLVTGRRSSVHKAGISVRYRAISEEEIAEEDLPRHIVDWPK